MNKFQRKSIALAVFGAITLAGCGAGTSSPGAAAGASMQRSGVITGFGSVYVNGIEYETTGSSFTLDGSSGSESNLKVGMVVTLAGSVNADGVTGIATSIDYADELEGIVTAVNIATDGTGTLTIMGQTVTIDAATVFESDVVSILAMDSIVVGNIVEVSGYSAGTGSILATRVEVKKVAKGADDEIELKGLVASVDTTAFTFMIGAQLVDYSSATLEGMSAPADGVYVEVKSVDGIVSNVLIASKIEIEGNGKKGIDGHDGDDVEMEGVVTSVVSSSEFFLNGQAVLIDANHTEFEHGALGDIIQGAKLEVAGTLNADGKLVADEIEFRTASAIEIEALLEGVDATAGTITLLGQTIKVNALTVKIDHRDDNGATPEHFFDLTDLAAGQIVEVKAYIDGSGTLVATSLKRDDGTSSTAKLEGPITSVSGTQAVVAGVTIELASMGLTPVVGDELQVEGAFAARLLTATSAEIDS